MILNIKSVNPRSRSDFHSEPVASRTGELPTACKNKRARTCAFYADSRFRSRSDSRSDPVPSRTGELPTAYKNTKAKILALALIFSLNLWPPVRASYLLLVKIKEREPALFTLILALF